MRDPASAYGFSGHMIDMVQCGPGQANSSQVNALDVDSIAIRPAGAWRNRHAAVDILAMGIGSDGTSQCGLDVRGTCQVKSMLVAAFPRSALNLAELRGGRRGRDGGDRTMEMMTCGGGGAVDVWISAMLARRGVPRIQLPSDPTARPTSTSCDRSNEDGRTSGAFEPRGHVGGGDGGGGGDEEGGGTRARTNGHNGGGAQQCDAATACAKRLLSSFLLSRVVEPQPCPVRFQRLSYDDEPKKVALTTSMGGPSGLFAPVVDRPTRLHRFGEVFCSCICCPQRHHHQPPAIFHPPINV